MKQIISIICLIYCFSSLSAQSLLPLSDAGKVSFAEVVKTDSLKKVQLYANAKAWLTTKGYKVFVSPADSSAGRLTAHHSFYVYARGYVFKKIHGNITYTATIEVKENKYRYTFDNFVFHYYKEDRNHKMVPSGKEKLLEEKKASGWQSLWESHQKNTHQTITMGIADLKATMSRIPDAKKELPVAAKKGTATENW